MLGADVVEPNKKQYKVYWDLGLVNLATENK